MYDFEHVCLLGAHSAKEVEPNNEAAIGLYAKAGYTKQSDTGLEAGFTNALWPNRSPRPLLYYKSLEPT